MNEPNSEKLDEIYDDLMKLERLLDLVKKELDKSLIANFEEVRTRQDTLGESPEEALAHVLREAVHNVAKGQETDLERFLKSAQEELRGSINIIEDLRQRR